MRVWEQGLVATYSMPGYKALIEEHYRAFQRPGTQIEVHGVKMDQLVQQTIRERGMEARAVHTTYMECGYDALAAGVAGRRAARHRQRRRRAAARPDHHRRDPLESRHHALQ